MTMTATLVAEALPQYCPTTNLYACSDGRHLLITIATLDVAGTLNATLGIIVRISESHLPTGADVFLSDESATVLDADGDPSNGMTPIAHLADCDDFASALESLGYTVE